VGSGGLRRWLDPVNAPSTHGRPGDGRRRETANGEDARSLGEDANPLLILQVPLKVRDWVRRESSPWNDVAPAPSATGAPLAKRGRAENEQAVLGQGAPEGPHAELGLVAERDPRFP